ncbi:MAG: prenyltransferase/squalene oxidase repeat-containing protein [Thermoguttaceae bacterium]
MFRHASRIVGAIVVLTGIHYRCSVCEAGDDVQSEPAKEPVKSKKLDDVEFANPTPSETGTGPAVRKTSTQTVRAVPAALVWLAKHQLSDGSWSLHDYTKECVDKTCTGQSDISSDAGATALGLLPFLAAGQSHQSKGPYKQHISLGLRWLIRHQQADGNLAEGSMQMMYGHGLATIALSEAYGLTGDKQVGVAAQRGVHFIVAAQNAADGGWRYNPGDPGDTSVLGWQLMALKSAHMAGLDIDGNVFARANKYLDSAGNHEGTEYGYMPGIGSTPAMTAAGLLGRQLLGVKRANPMFTGGTTYLMKHSPEEKLLNIYYWYFGTQVMHNMGGTEWDVWNGKIRDILVRTQVRKVDQCANGSWDPAKDAWGQRGGRIMQTSLSALSLLVYYRYLPLSKSPLSPHVTFAVEN